MTVQHKEFYSVVVISYKGRESEKRCSLSYTHTHTHTHTHVCMGFPGESVLKNPPASAGDMGSILGQEGPLERETAGHRSALAWEIPWTVEPGGYSPRGHKSLSYD